MAFTLSNGMSVAVAKTYEAKLNFSAASNEPVCELTVVGSTIDVGDWVEVTAPGWGRINGRVVRAAPGTTATSLLLEGINTSDTELYPAGLVGAGSVRKIAAWSEITQVKSVATTGGEQQFADATDINDVTAKQIPTIRSAMSMTLTLLDDPTLSFYADVTKADESRSPYAVRFVFANKSVMGGNVYWSLKRVPNVTANEVMTGEIVLSFSSDPIRYAS